MITIHELMIRWLDCPINHIYIIYIYIYIERERENYIDIDMGMTNHVFELEIRFEPGLHGMI